MKWGWPDDPPLLSPPSDGHPSAAFLRAARPVSAASDLLTDLERRAVDLTAELTGVLKDIVGHGPTRMADMGELIVHVHGIQQAVLSQAAARAYPDRYRLLGEVLAPDHD